MSWSAAQYTKFENERNRPIRDLLAQLPDRAVATAADLGCGPGNSTELLRQRFPRAAITGVDSSADMIAAARQRLPDVAFEIGDISGWQGGGGRFDVLFANASLQWVPDHATLLPALLGRLAPGGSLAVQIPDNFQEPAHVLMRSVAADAAWADRLEAAPRAMDSRQTAAWYYAALRDCGAAVDVWRTIYHHPLAGGAAAVVEWFRGSGLRPYLQPLDDAEQARFLARYQDAVAEAYPALPDGTVLLPFPRLFFIATLPG